MHGTLTTLIDRLSSSSLTKADVITWGAPVPVFGDLLASQVATLGLNPSNREFVDEMGRELQGDFRRFHTLGSLGIPDWTNVDAAHLRLILESCRCYFLGNPYNKWFKTLNQIISRTESSYFDPDNSACHLDLIPYATARKWADLAPQQRYSLLTASADTLGLLIRESQIRVLILNGKSVVDHFEELAGIRLCREQMAAWTLHRRTKPDVAGISYSGTIHMLSGFELPQKVLVLGYNHNIQSSFGVTSQVIAAIRNWIGTIVERSRR